MTGIERFLEQEPDELEGYLLKHARRGRAPDAARERALANVLSAVGQASISSAAVASGPKSLVIKSTGWMVAKWVIIGLGTGMFAITAAHRLEQPTDHRDRKTPKASEVTTASPKPAPPAAAENMAAPGATPTPTSSAHVSQKLSLELRETQDDEAAVVVQEQPAVIHSSGEQATELTRELLLLRQARTALEAHSAGRASQLLDAYTGEFPTGTLRAEAAALRVETVGELGDPDRALLLAQAFLTSYPASPLTGRIRSLADEYRRRAR